MKVRKKKMKKLILAFVLLMGLGTGEIKAMSKFEKQWLIETKWYKTTRELCNTLRRGHMLNVEECDSEFGLGREEKEKYEFMKPYVMEVEKKAKIEAKKIYSVREQEGRVYAGIAMETPLVGSTDAVSQDSKFDGTEHCNIKFAGLDGFVGSKNGLVNEIMLRAYNTSLDEVLKITTLLAEKYGQYEHKKEKHKILNNTTTETLIFSNKGDRITLTLDTTQNKTIKYTMDLDYLSKKTIEEEEIESLKKQNIENTELDKEKSEMGGL